LKNSLDMICGAGSVTFTRSTTATYIDRYGVVQDAAINEARFEKEGLLIEGASTNKCLQSEDLSTTWSTAACAVSANAIDAPDGTTTADGVVSTATDVYHYVDQYITDSATEVVASVFCKAGDKDWLRILVQLLDSSNNSLLTVIAYVDAANGTVGTVSNGSLTLIECADGWYRCNLICDEYTGGTTVNRVRIALGPASADGDTSFTGDGSTVNTYFWGAQVEEMPFSTSYIPTTTAAVTRAKDVCYVTLADNMPNANEDITILADFNLLTAVIYAVNRYIFSTQSVNIRGYVGTSSVKVTVNYNDKYKNLITITDNKEYRVGLVLDDGTLNDTPAEITSSFGNYIYIGNSSLFGHISNFRIYDVALTEAEMRIA